LELRCYLVWKLRNRVFHVHFQFMAVIITRCPVHCTVFPRVQSCPIVFHRVPSRFWNPETCGLSLSFRCYLVYRLPTSTTGKWSPSLIFHFPLPVLSALVILCSWNTYCHWNFLDILCAFWDQYLYLVSLGMSRSEMRNKKWEKWRYLHFSMCILGVGWGYDHARYTKKDESDRLRDEQKHYAKFGRTYGKHRAGSAPNPLVFRGLV